MSTGLQAQLGSAEESTYGTAVTVDRFHEFNSESLDRTNRTLNSSGIRAGTRNLRRGSRRVLTAREGAGDITMEVATTGMGRFFKHMLGTVATSTPGGATTTRLHTFTFGSLLGKALTLQKGVPQTDGTVKPFTFVGSKVTSWELSISVDEIAALALSIDARDVSTAIALASASYTNTRLFHFAQAVLKVAGTSIAQVTDATVSGENPMKTDRFYLGSAGLKAEPLDNDFPAVTGQLSAEFVSQATFYDRFAADSGAELILEFTGQVLEGALSEFLRVTIPDVRFTGEAPKVGGPDVVAVNVPYEATWDGTNSGVKIEYQTSDATP